MCVFRFVYIIALNSHSSNVIHSIRPYPFFSLPFSVCVLNIFANTNTYTHSTLLLEGVWILSGSLALQLVHFFPSLFGLEHKFLLATNIRHEASASTEMLREKQIERETCYCWWLPLYISVPAQKNASLSKYQKNCGFTFALFSSQAEQPQNKFTAFFFPYFHRWSKRFFHTAYCWRLKHTKSMSTCENLKFTSYYISLMAVWHSLTNFKSTNIETKYFFPSIFIWFITSLVCSKLIYIV